MRFVVSRTSDMTGSPCPGAYKVDSKGWCVDIDSLQELCAFVAEHGEIIIWWDHTIEIYDDYRE